MTSAFAPGDLAPLFAFNLDRAFQASAGVGAKRVLFIGQKLSTGSATAATLYTVRSASEAASLFGSGSQLHRSLKAFFRGHPTADVRAVGLADLSGGTAAAYTVVFGGTATEAGIVTLYFEGQRVQVPVAIGDEGADMAATAEPLIDALAEVGFTTSTSTATITCTAKNKGEVGGYANNLLIKANFRGIDVGEELPAGVTVAITQTVAGTGNPDIGDAWAALGQDDVFRYIHIPWTDTTTLDALEAEMESRWTPARGVRGHAFTGRTGTVSGLASVGNARTTDAHITMFGFESGVANAPHVLSAAALAQIVKVADASPASPYSAKLALGESADDLLCLAAPAASQWEWSERNTLLKAGITPLLSRGSALAMSRVVTLYKENPSTGQPDTKFRELQTLLSLMEWIEITAGALAAAYPEHILVDDGTPVKPTIKSVTPEQIRGTILGAYATAQELALVEAIDTFKTALVVARDTVVRSRVNFLAPPQMTAPLYQLDGTIQVRA